MGQLEANRASVLVVDDNPLIVNVLKGLFLAQDYEVFCCANGQEALDVLDRKYVDVIVSDVMMPKMGGYELHDMLRERPEFSHIPFIFLTALADDTEVCKGREVGADDYMVKPFDPHQLLSVVKGKVIRSRKLKNLSEEQYDKFRKKIIHTLSHEFRTPLVAINTGTELLLGQETTLDSDKTQNLLEAIQRGGQRLERLVNDFMLMQQIEAGIALKLYNTRAAIHDISEVVEEFLRNKIACFENEDVTYGLDDQCESVNVWIYEPQIIDILSRLVDNAVKFSPKERLHFEVGLYPWGETIEIAVRDRGIGMDVQQVREAIDVFGQINREKLEQQGGGLGLAISNHYATMHGGKLDFENRDGGGSIVSLFIPRYKG
ncbi:hybrid sensor histidine kinase/response regulator [Oligoflexia bacterium]|nr:hybrid sensor histidine kinase/response regulator [Oligoflexia bacterium]